MVEVINRDVLVYFSESEIDEIKKRFDDVVTKVPSVYSPKYSYMFISSTHIPPTHIYKTDDEWFYVSIKNKKITTSYGGHIDDYSWFECDQIDGVIKCLEDKVFTR